MTTLQAIVCGGWGLQAVSWVYAIARVGRGAAAAPEWGFEIAVRLGVLALVIWSVCAPPAGPMPPFRVLPILLVVLFLSGHSLATLARLQLGSSWGIGTGEPVGPRPPGAVRRGLYRILRHPIYLGTGAAAAAQALLLRNLPSVLLAACALVINAWKIARENRWLRDAAPAD